MRISIQKLPAVTERAFQAQVISMAKMLGWMVYHTHDSRRSEPGFPDLVLVRERIIYAELKTDKGRQSPEQLIWLSKLNQAGAETYLWRPRDWDEIEKRLKSR